MFPTVLMVTMGAVVPTPSRRVLPHFLKLRVLRCSIVTMLKLTCVVRTMPLQFFSFLRCDKILFCLTLRNFVTICDLVLVSHLPAVRLCA